MSKDRSGTGELRDDDLPEDKSLLPPNPGDNLDAPPAAADAAFAGHDGADIFRRLIAMCMPDSNTSYRGARAWRAALNRMVAVMYHVAPEQFLGKNQTEIATALGITPRAFRKQLATVAAMLAARRPPRPRP